MDQTSPPIPGLSTLSPNALILIVYGSRAYGAAKAPGLNLHPYSTIELPAVRTPDEDDVLARPLAKLAGRFVVIWPAAGDEGRARALEHAHLLAALGVASVGIAALHEPRLANHDLGDPLPHGVPPSIFRRSVDAARDAAKARALPPCAGRAARAVPPCGVAPNPQAVFGDICTFLARHLAENALTIETMALWCLHAWATRRTNSIIDVSPRLMLRGLDARADHARALRVIAWLTPAPLIVSRTIAAHVLGAIEAERPTLLFDDIAGGTLYRRDMRALIAAGAYRDGLFLTTRSQRHESGRVLCFAPTAVATMAPLPEDVRLRSIVVPMLPAPLGEVRARLTVLDPPAEVSALRAKMDAVANAMNADRFALDALPRSLSTSAAENWAPLLMLAAQIDPKVAARAVHAAVALSATAPPIASNLALLRDIRDLGVAGPGTRIASNDLVAKLTADPEAAWASIHHGRALTPRHLAERLSNFGIRPGVMRRDAGGTLTRGYRGAAFIDAFARYLGDVANDTDTLEASDA